MIIILFLLLVLDYLWYSSNAWLTYFGLLPATIFLDSSIFHYTLDLDYFFFLSLSLFFILLVRSISITKRKLDWMNALLPLLCQWYIRLWSSIVYKRMLYAKWTYSYFDRSETASITMLLLLLIVIHSSTWIIKNPLEIQM
jgi:hypothetical protein